MLLQAPRPRVDEFDEFDPSRKLSLTILFPPGSFEFITTGEDSGPCFACKITDENDEGSRDGDTGRFELKDDVVSFV